MKWPALVLFDLDGVLAPYGHDVRVKFLAERTGAEAEAVEQALFGSGLETAADLGEYDAEGVVAELSLRLGKTVNLDDCIAARAASMQADPEVLTLAALASQRAGVAILTNNGLIAHHFRNAAGLRAELTTHDLLERTP